MKKIILLLIGITFCLAGCEEDPTIPTDKVISNMGITNNDVKMKKGEQFLVQINNGNGTYKVTSEDTNVATAKMGIAQNNIIITGVFKGETEILVEDTINKEKETIKVEVEYGRLSIDTKVKNYGEGYNGYVSGVISTKDEVINKGGFQLRVDETYEMEIVESNGSCEIIDTKNTNKNVAKVTLNGNKISVKALQKGYTTFVITDQSKGKRRLEIFVLVEDIKEDYDAKILVNGGTFTMGKDKNNVYHDGDSTKDYYKDPTDNKWYWDVFPAHKVTVKNFKMGKYPVTNAQFVKFLNEKGNVVTKVARESGFEPEEVPYYKIEYTGGNLIIEENGKFKVIEGYENYPVDRVSYFGAKAYAEWVGGRLPTEAEYEYASYGGQLSQGFSYPGANDIKDISYIEKLKYNNSYRVLDNPLMLNSRFPVGQQKPNELGLYDMIEKAICADKYHDNYEGAPTDGSAWGEPKDYCVLRGRYGIEIKNFARNEFWLGSEGGIRVVWDN